MKKKQLTADLSSWICNRTTNSSERQRWDIGWRCFFSLFVIESPMLCTVSRFYDERLLFYVNVVTILNVKITDCNFSIWKYLLLLLLMLWLDFFCVNMNYREEILLFFLIYWFLFYFLFLKDGFILVNHSWFWLNLSFVDALTRIILACVWIIEKKFFFYKSGLNEWIICVSS